VGSARSLHTIRRRRRRGRPRLLPSLLLALITHRPISVISPLDSVSINKVVEIALILGYICNPEFSVECIEHFAWFQSLSVTINDRVIKVWKYFIYTVADKELGRSHHLCHDGLNNVWKICTWKRINITLNKSIYMSGSGSACIARKD